MAVRKRGRNVIEVNGRSFVWWVHREREVRIASNDKHFAVAFRWIGDPQLAVTGDEFPGLSPSEPRPVLLLPPTFIYRSPAGLARQVILWALYSGPHKWQRIQVKDKGGTEVPVMAEVADQERWQKRFDETQPQLAKLAEKVRADIRAGRVRNTEIDQL
jgi:hypothetical protein